MNRVRILLFATLRQNAGTKALEMDVPEGLDVRGLKAEIGQKYPALRKSMESVLVAINREYAFDDLVIPTDAEVALFPPVSGG